LAAPAAIETEVGETGATVSFVAMVPVNVAVLPAVSVVVTETTTEPSKSAEASMPETVTVPPPATWVTAAVTEVPFVNVTRAVSEPEAAAGQVTDAETAPTLETLMTFAELPPPAATETEVGETGATVSLLAMVPVNTVALPAVSMVVTETTTEPSESAEALMPEAVAVPPPAT
jgi:hypothetical protein